MLRLSKNRSYSVPVLMRALDILEFLYRSDSATKSNEISDIVRVPRTTTYRILRTLVDRGYVSQDLDGRFRYRHSNAIKFVPMGFEDERISLRRIQEFEAALSADQIIGIILALLRGFRSVE